MLHIRGDFGQELYPELTMDCPTCKSKKSYIDYYDHSACKVCGRSSFDTKGNFMLKCRRKKDIKRNKMSEILGIKPNTLTSYEHGEPSKKVFDRFMDIFLKDIKGKR